LAQTEYSAKPSFLVSVTSPFGVASLIRRDALDFNPHAPHTVKWIKYKNAE
jgi:hypothetical protein